MPFPIRAKLLGGFALDLLLMCILSLVTWQLMGVMNSRAAFVEQHTVPSLNGVAAINSVISRYRVQQLEYLIYTNAADKARSRRKMAELEAEMAGHLNAYRPLISSPAEAERFANVEADWARVLAANYDSFIPAASEANTGSVQPFYSRMNPLYGSLEAEMAQLAAESQLQASAALAVVRGAYDTARRFIAFDTLLAIVISAAIGLTLSGRIAQRLGRLTSAADKVAAGDLQPTLEVTNRDELGRLAQSFNQMVASLRQQRRALQERNAELQTSLARQEQLMADLMHRKRAEEEAYRAQAAAEAASHAKSMFLATMSHELRTPLNAILGYAQLMRLTTPQLDLPAAEGTVDPLDRILVAGRHLTAMISDVLDFSKIEQGKIELTLTSFDPCALVREALDVVTPLAQRQHNALRLICAPEPGTMYADVGKLRQVLLNLLSNAAKFTEHGIITLRLSIEQDEATTEQGWYVFGVSDTGIGIAAEQLTRLFQPFSQLDASVTRRYEGTGLGLALSRQLCLAMGGEISVVSEPGHGSTFTVRLPASVALNQHAPQALLGTGERLETAAVH